MFRVFCFVSVCFDFRDMVIQGRKYKHIGQHSVYLVGAAPQVWYSGNTLKLDTGQHPVMKMSVGLSLDMLTSPCFHFGLHSVDISIF